MTTEEIQSSDPNTPALRIGLVGCGGRGMGAVNDSLDINENVKVVALADLDSQVGQRAKEALGEAFGDRAKIDDSKIHSGLDAYKRILDDPDVDIVYFATPPGFRPRHLKDAVEAKKHVFAEKPSCVDPAGYRICLEAHDRAVANKTAIVTGTQYRRQTNYIEAVNKISDGGIGDVISVTARYCTSDIWYRERSEGMSNLAYQLKNWMHFIWLSGDQICEQAVHNIDVINWVMGGPPVSAFATGGRFHRPADSQMWDSMSVNYIYPNDKTLSMTCRQWPNSTTDTGNTFYGTKGSMHIGAANRGSKMYDRDGKEIWSAKGSIAAAYKAEHKALVDSIVAGEPIVELKQTADSSLTAVMGRMSAYSGQQVDWDFVTKKSVLDLWPTDFDDATFPAAKGFCCAK